jgi:Xaa-Pro aminopeptidase
MKGCIDVINRLKKLRDILKERNIDAAIITGRPNTIYFSGFTGSTSYLIISQDKAWLIVDFRYTIQAKQQVYKDIIVVQYEESFYSTINELIKANGYKTAGFEGNILTFSEYQALKEKLTFLDHIVSLGDTIDSIRTIKDSDEIERINEAVLLGDKVFEHILGFIKPGIKETDVAAEMEYAMKKLGAKGPSFETIVAAGKRSAMCHGTATENVIQKGDPVVLDFGVIYRNYCSDMTRTIFIGKPADELKEIYRIVLNAQKKAIDGIVSGMSGFEADRIARDIISKRGYGSNFGHSLGHGVGIEVHENPRLSVISRNILKDGMVFSVEPGIYIDGLGGVRIEDLVVLSEGKPRILTTSTKDMIIL